jgi:hypothetical protein
MIRVLVRRSRNVGHIPPPHQRATEGNCAATRCGPGFQELPYSPRAAVQCNPTAGVSRSQVERLPRSSHYGTYSRILANNTRVLYGLVT